MAFNWFISILTLMLINLSEYCNGEAEILATPKDTTVHVGSNTNLTCIFAEPYNGNNAELQWIIAWDATASVQIIPANKSQQITGYYYGRDAERGDYVVEYENKMLGETGADCTHVVHISVLHIRNTTLRDAGTFACGNQRQRAKVTVIETVVENNLADCDLVTVIIGLVCIVGWCLSVVEFGVLICMCLQKPKHAARRRRIVRRVSVLLPQSRRAAYDVRMKKRSTHVNRRYAEHDDDDMVQHVPRMIEIEPEEKEQRSPNEKRQFYVNIRDNENTNDAAELPVKAPLVTFAPFPAEQQKEQPKSSKPTHRNKGDNRKYQKKRKNVPSNKKRPETLAVVKPFGLQEAQISNPVFLGDDNEREMYINLPGPSEKKSRRQSHDSFDNDEMVSTPL